MIRIETESDIERLRQVALLQETELQRLHKRLLELTQELAVARGEDAILAIQQELAFLKEQLDARNRELFGASSEKRPRDRSGDAVNNGTTERTGHGRRDQPELPMIDVFKSPTVAYLAAAIERARSVRLSWVITMSASLGISSIA